MVLLVLHMHYRNVLEMDVNSSCCFSLSVCKNSLCVPINPHVLTVVASVPAAKCIPIYLYIYISSFFSPGSHLLCFSGRSRILSPPSRGSRAGAVELQWFLCWPWMTGTAAPAVVLWMPFDPALPGPTPPFVPFRRMRHPEQGVQRNSRCF